MPPKTHSRRCPQGLCVRCENVSGGLHPRLHHFDPSGLGGNVGKPKTPARSPELRNEAALSPYGI